MEEPQLGPNGVHEPHGPFVAFGHQDDNPGDKGHEQQAEDGHEKVGHPEAVDGERRDQREPEDDVQHNGRTEPLSGEGERRVGTADPGTRQEPVAERGGRGIPPRDTVAERQRRELDPRNRGKARVFALRDERAGQFEVGEKRKGLKPEADHREERVRRREHVDRLVGASDLGDDEVLEDEADDQQLSKTTDRSRPSPPVRALSSHPTRSAPLSKLTGSAERDHERPEGPAPVGERVLRVG